MFNSNKTISGIEFAEIPLTKIDRDNQDNPRLGANEARDELKNSIQSTEGRYVVLEVSQRPGDTQYCLLRGGNTRLELLHELHNEWDGDGDSIENPYTKIKCMVFPWAGDIEKGILSATENIVRGKLCYAEEARAVAILQEKYLESGVNESQVSFVEWAKNLGMSMNINESSVSRYLATNRYITPLMPRLMIEGKAQQAIAIYLLKERAKVLRVYKVRENHESQVDELTARVLAAALPLCDDVVLDKTKLRTVLVDTIEGMENGWLNPDERREILGQRDMAIDKFAKKYGIDKGLEFGKDQKRNAAVLLVDALSEGERLSAHKRTREMKAMNVENDITGFYKLASLLDVSGRNILAKIIKEA